MSTNKKVRVRVMDDQGRSLGDLEPNELAEYITKLRNLEEILVNHKDPTIAAVKVLSTASYPVCYQAQATASTNVWYRVKNPTRSWLYGVLSTGEFVIYDENAAAYRFKLLTDGTVKLPIKFGYQMFLHNYPTELPIDSIGGKLETGHHLMKAELYEQATTVIFGANLGVPTADDAVVDIALYDYTASEDIATITFAGEYGTKEVTIEPSNLVSRANHSVVVRFIVKTASATSGATQEWRTAYLVVIYDYTP